MEIVYERKINYYETDKMGVVHHSNYIRYFEEARTYWLEELEMPFELLEENNITIPVLRVSCEYKHHVTFGDTILIRTYMKEYTGVRMTVGYDVTDKKTGKTLVEKCEMPGSIYELADANLQHGMQGTRSYRNFPVWGRVIKDELVQVVTPYELNLYKSLHSITIPQELDLKGEEGNPVFVFYSLI